MLLLSTSLGYRRKQDPAVRLQVWHSKHTEQQSSHKKHELNKKRCYLCATDVLCHLMTVLVLLSVLGSVFLTSVTMCWSCLSTNVLHCKYKVIFLSGENKAGFPNCILIKAKQQQKQPQPTNQPTIQTTAKKQPAPQKIWCMQLSRIKDIQKGLSCRMKIKHIQRIL